MTENVIKAVEDGIKGVEAKLSAAIEKYEGQVAEAGKADNEIRAEVKALADKFDASITEIAQKMDTASERKNADASVGEQFIKSEAFKSLQSGQVNSARVEIKNTILTGDVAPVGTVVLPGVAGGPVLPLTLRERIPTVQVSGNAVSGVREASFTNNAAETAEGATKPESAITFEPFDVVIQTVAHWVKVSNQLIQDAPAVISYINGRLRYGLAERIDKQLLIGNGTPPNLKGLTAAGNFTAFTAGTGASLIDSIISAKYAMWANGRTPDTVIVNPADWGAMVGTKGTDGHYLYGAPGFNAPMNPFGLDVVLNNNMPVGSFLVGALRSSATIYQRQGATVEMGYVNDDFIKNLVTIRAEERLGLGVEDAAGILYGDFSA